MGKKEKARKPISQPGREAERGQSLVEFTLVALFLVLVLMGILDLGRAFFAKIAITDAAGEGAIYAALNPRCVTDTGGACGGSNNVVYRVRHASESALVNWNDVQVEVIAPAMTPGNEVTVRVEYNFPLITPVIASIVGSDILVIEAEAVQTIQ